MSEPKWKTLVRQVKENDPKLTVLDNSCLFKKNGIGIDGAVALADALRVNTTLSDLRLSSNWIGREGAKALADALRVNTTLSRLDLHFNAIGDEGAMALAGALRINTTLSILILSNNSIGDEGAMALADALRINTALSHLDMDFDTIGDEGAAALLTALKDYDTTLQSIKLTLNSFSRSLKKQIKEIVSRNKRGTRTDLAQVQANREAVLPVILQEEEERKEKARLEKQESQERAEVERAEKARSAQLQWDREILRKTEVSENARLKGPPHKETIRLLAKQQQEAAEAKAKLMEEEEQQREETARLEHLRRQEEEAEQRKHEKEAQIHQDEIYRLAKQRAEKARQAQLVLDQMVKRKKEVLENARLEQLKHQKQEAEQRKREKEAQLHKETIRRLAKQQQEAAEAEANLMDEEEQQREAKARLEHLKRQEEEAEQRKQEKDAQTHKEEIYRLAKQQREADAKRKQEKEEEQQRQEEEEVTARNAEDTMIVDSRLALQQSRQSKKIKPIFVTKEYVQSIQTTELLGNGFFGTVHRGYDRVLAIEFAVKTNRVPIHLLDEEQLDRVKKSFHTELETLHAFKHPYIASLYAYHLSPDLKSDQFLLYELARNGTLSGFLKSDFGRDRLSSFQQRVRIAVEIMTAIQFLHNGTEEVKCFHRDIKADNIVLMADMTAKLIDCGLAKFVTHTGEASATGGGKGTDEYMCPMYQKNMLTEYEAKCDVYSFGVVLAELWIGHLQNHRHPSTGEKVNYYETYILDQDDIVVDMDDALDITDCVKMPSYAVKFAQLSIRCMSRKLKNRPSGSEVLTQLQAILRKRERDTKENADVQEKQEVEYPTSTSVRMQCVECRQEGVRCHPTTSMGYSCLPCLLLDLRRKFISQVIPEIHAARYENRDLHYQSRSENRELHERTQASLDSFSGVLASLDARMVNQIPVLFVLLPVERAKLRQHPRSWLKDRARAKYRIYFVCSHSSRAVRNPLKFRVSKDWVTKIAPLLACSLYALQMAGKAVTGIDLNLGAAGALVENIDTEKLSEMLDSVMALLSEHDSNQELLENLHSKKLDHENICRLDKESIAPIVELASSQRDWFQEMKHVRHRSSNQVRSMWVLNEYASTNQFETIV